MISRRGFIKGIAVAAGIAAMPKLWQPAKQIFLPPSGGWFGQQFEIRELEQYAINSDEIVLRYDAAWIKPDGGIEQEHVFDRVGSIDIVSGLGSWSIEDCRNRARRALEKAAWERGLIIPYRLEIPRGFIRATYV